MIAETTALAIARWSLEQSGVYHLTCGGRTTWYGFAKAILAGYAQYAGSKGWPALKALSDAVEAITTEQYPTPVKRPANSLLDNTKLKQDFGLQMPEWNDALTMALEEAATLAI
jgi:dTDP-4-dehydrorhamnose reductase